MQEALAENIQAALVIVRRAMAQVEALPHLGAGALPGLTLRGMAERLYLQRRKRDEHFPPGLFGEPAWDLLLALFVAREDGRSLSLAEAYEAAQVKPAAGRALVARMESEGLLVRDRGERGRKRRVRLTSGAVERLSDYLLSCAAIE